MSLKQVKMAGFKSFVDPTTVKFPSHKVAIIGPNGCGKSNVIDAVRWVMGESSAKTLRGESMADVIFNGSSNRQPVNQASVELLFDNSKGRFGGEYANYAEIAIRREVRSDGTSNYYLNGTRCRRRDITDIFLGTGLGPRSYAIIGQGMIARIIEAKPDDLRVYLEEAAGISKYKERRRETENRIRHTRDNLERLTDLREELGKQLDRLQRQAKAAERYQTYKTEQQQLKSELYALRWQSLQQQRVDIVQTLKRHEVDLEAKRAELRRLDNAIEQFREVSQSNQDAFNAVQERYYQLGTEISRIEERLVSSKERRQQLSDALSAAKRSKMHTEEHLAEDQSKIATLKAKLAQLKPAHQASSTQLQAEAVQLQAAEQAMTNWQAHWESFNEKAAKALQQAEVQQTDIQHTEQQKKRLQNQQEQVQQQLDAIDLRTLEQGLAGLKKALDEALAGEVQAKQRCENSSALQVQQREQLNSVQQQLSQARQTLQQQRGRQASLEALQQVALGQQDEGLNQWLQEQNLAQQPRLAQKIEVSSGWDRAVEIVLGEALQAICIEQRAGVPEWVEQLQQRHLCVQLFHTKRKASALTVTSNCVTLASKITGCDAVLALLQGVYVAEDLAAAYALEATLAPHESVVTQSGVWLRQGLTYVLAADKDPQAGVLQRAEALNALTQTLAATADEVASLEHALAQAETDLVRTEDEVRLQQQQLTKVTEKRSEQAALLKIKENQCAQQRDRQKQLQQEMTTMNANYAETQTHLVQTRLAWQQSLEQVEAYATEKNSLQTQKNQVQATLERHKSTYIINQEKQQHLTVQVQTLGTECNVTEQNLQRITTQLSDLSQRHDDLMESIASSQAPLVADQKLLEQKLDDQLTLEESVNEARQKVEHSQSMLRHTEQQREQVNQELQTMREHLQSQQMTHEGLQVRQTTLQEQLAELGGDMQALIATLSEEANELEWSTRLQELDQRIQRLGAINLAAIEEFQTESERKHYLDEQNDDLEKALATLANAIHKIDKETRSRFKDTVDKVDQGLQSLFPRLFGGGQAHLELIGDDLLSTGVNIVARPPGKRNTSIHLLSGGEKALTAVALVFAIFQLNPSPFCMLDEVDAPLDEANVTRFCEMVGAMSEHVQFIFITHNKVTMELADQLMGVTMNEPGVSRLVSVDIEKAVALAEPSA